MLNRREVEELDSCVMKKGKVLTKSLLVERIASIIYLMKDDDVYELNEELNKLGSRRRLLNRNMVDSRLFR